MNYSFNNYKYCPFYIFCVGVQKTGKKNGRKKATHAEMQSFCRPRQRNEDCTRLLEEKCLQDKTQKNWSDKVDCSARNGRTKVLFHEKSPNKDSTTANGYINKLKKWILPLLIMFLVVFSLLVLEWILSM